MTNLITKNDATHATGGIQISEYGNDKSQHNRSEDQNQQSYDQIMTLEEKARDYMQECGITFTGQFGETGDVPIQFVGYETDGTKSKSSDKTERLFCYYLEDSRGRWGLRITFRSWHASWGTEWITKTLWEDVSHLTDQEHDELTLKRAEQKKRDKKRLEEEKLKDDQLANYCLDLFARAEKIGTSPYIEKKKLKFTDNIRYQTERNVDTGVIETRILVPLYNIQGQFRAMQVIYPEKRQFSSCDKEPRDKHIIGRYSGCFFTFGKIEEMKRIRICEGFSTAATVFELTGDTTVAAISRTNLRAVCRQLKKKYPKAELIICADNDLQTDGNPGLSDAVKVAKELAIEVAYPRFPSSEEAKRNLWSDFNDLFTQIEGGYEIAKEQLDELFVWNEIETAERVKIIEPKNDMPDYDWPNPKPIHAALYPVPIFDAERLLPEALKHWIVDEADRMPCPTDFIAAAVFVALGSIIGARCGIKPKTCDDWLIVPNLWGGIIGLPSAKKSPAIAAALRPLDRLVSNSMKIHRERMEGYAVEQIVSEAKKDAIISKIKESAKKHPEKSLDIMAQQLLEERKEGSHAPILRRYKSNDTTCEKLGELLRDNPAGLLILRDELVGLISSWDKDGREGERSFFLESWNGTGSFDTDRIKRGSIFIPNLCTSIFGGIQPDKLIVYLEQASKALSNDGLLQRFQVLVYPNPQDWQWRDRPPDHEARERAYKIFEKLATFEPVSLGASSADESSKFPFFKFDEEAQEIFIQWSKKLHVDILAKEDNPLIAQHLAKYDKLFPALALILHLVDCVDKEWESWGPVKAASALRAAAWCSYLESHARRCYGLLADDGLRSAQALAEKIQLKLKGKIEAKIFPDEFTARDIRRNQWRNLTTEVSVLSAIEWLEDEGWIRPQKVGGNGPGSGKPTIRYSINPKLKGMQEYSIGSNDIGLTGDYSVEEVQ